MIKPILSCLAAVSIAVFPFALGLARGSNVFEISSDLLSADAFLTKAGLGSLCATRCESVADVNETPYIYTDRSNGVWIYKSDTLQIDIRRIADIDQGIIWFETYIHCSKAEKLYSILTKNAHTEQSPVIIANQTNAVLAFSDDFFGDRRQKKAKQGIIIRNGNIISEDTYPNSSYHFPNLEIMALYKDCRLKTYQSNAYSASEYINMGVTDTYAFGPILVNDGKIDERLKNDDYMPYLDPRCALGMIQPDYFILLTVEGRTSTSKGVRLAWLAHKMIELDAVEAINLDGGNTTALVFMGDLINHSENISEKNIRHLTSMIGIGTRK
jgi:exopolysaccharide biosynthesis protein